MQGEESKDRVGEERQGKARRSKRSGIKARQGVEM